MKNKKHINSLIEDLENIANIEKCLTCQCFIDILHEFEEALKVQAAGHDIKERISRILERATATHECSGCDPCLPVPVSNALVAMGGTAAASVCRPREPIPLGVVMKAPAWPVEQGEYIVGAATSPVAISTLGSDDLPRAVAERAGQNTIAIIGKTHTENIGIEKIVKNTISNPHIRFLILCGKDTKGHVAGQSLIALTENGVTHDRTIIGSKGQRPALKNLEFSEIESFRAQVSVINLIGIDDSEQVAKKARGCSKNSPGQFDKYVAVKKVPHREAREPGRLILDPSGFFIIYSKKEEGTIYCEHYKADGTLNEVIHGADPVLIASTVVERGLVSRLDHAAYLGRELEKAYLSMRYGFPYVQDSAPGKE